MDYSGRLYVPAMNCGNGAGKWQQEWEILWLAGRKSGGTGQEEYKREITEACLLSWQAGQGQ